MNYYAEAFKKYAVFEGRARRKEYWYFVLFNLFLATALAFVSEPLYAIYVFAAFIPGITVGVRRLHDIGKSGWWLLIALIPLIGTILLILDLAKDSQPGDNQYGPNPKEPREGTASQINAAVPNYCRKCGNQIDIDSKFCTHCGSKVT